MGTYMIDDLTVTGMVSLTITKRRRLLEAQIKRNLGTLVPLGMNWEEYSNYKEVLNV